VAENALNAVIALLNAGAPNLLLAGIPRYHKRCIKRIYENDDERQDNDFF
jgi:hypothetical protein